MWKWLVVVLLAWCCYSAQAQTYPTRPVRVVVPQPPGGTMDTLARAVSEQLTRQLGQQFVVDNRSGANGIIGGEIVVKAPADGYTLLYTSNSLANNQLVYEKPPFDVLRDFTPISQVMRSQGYYVVIHPQVPAQSFKELVELSRGGKTPVHFGSAGVGNSAHLLGELVNKRAGAKFVHVPYKGLAPVIAAVMGNEIQLAFASPLTVVQHIKAGRLRALASSGAKRWQGLPDVPTLTETVMPGFVYDPGWHGLFAPAALPNALATRIHEEVAKALANQKVRDTMEFGSQLPLGTPPAVFRAFLQTYLKEMAVLSKETGVKPQ